MAQCFDMPTGRALMMARSKAVSPSGVSSTASVGVAISREMVILSIASSGWKTDEGNAVTMVEGKQGDRRA
jgi:hypothetical protein